MREDDSDDELVDESEEEDIHPLGFRKGDEAVVCYGDDWPVCFIGWLEKLVDEYRELYGTAEEEGHGDRIRALGIPDTAGGFVSAIGVELRGKPWTGFLISGTWIYGWIKVGTEHDVEVRGREMLETLRLAIGRDR